MHMNKSLLACCLSAFLFTAAGCSDRQADTGTTNGNTMTESSTSGEKIKDGRAPTDQGTVTREEEARGGHLVPNK
jgi:hypothetical protein